MNPQNEFNDRLIRLPELERIFGVCKRTVRRKAESWRVAAVKLNKLIARLAINFRNVIIVAIILTFLSRNDSVEQIY